ncbi:MAG: rhamnulose-1-phosphate aldolase [Massiliimalia sp.]|jgi:rhamnulose-1-phosphate aldolase
MKDILKAPFVVDMCKLTANLYRLGWDERNGGNVSVMIPEEEVAEYLDVNKVIRHIPMEFDGSPVAGKIFIVTGTGKYFKNVMDDPETNLGIIRVAADGKGVDLLWGYADGGRPTSELPAHLMTHIERLKVDPNHRVVLHTHATNVIAMTFVHDLDEREFTRTLWQMCTECMVVFADGVSVLPWMLCGTDEIGRITAEKMKEFRLVVWGMHGIFGTGTSIDEAFGLVETVEKAAEIYMKIAHLPIKQTITDDQLWEIADAFHVTPRAGFLNPRTNG